MKKKIIAVISGTAILIIAAGRIYGKFESSHKEGEPDVVGTFSVNRDENITVVANREEDVYKRQVFLFNKKEGKDYGKSNFYCKPKRGNGKISMYS